ncbi:MAG TPA: hypothetical protein VMB51_05275 [Solirubrobacteraceae bacterium]|nr:hypothetical protein [Solirubrobacteraceae bacterium]
MRGWLLAIALLDVGVGLANFALAPPPGSFGFLAGSFAVTVALFPAYVAGRLRR